MKKMQLTENWSSKEAIPEKLKKLVTKNLENIGIKKFICKGLSDEEKQFQLLEDKYKGNYVLMNRETGAMTPYQKRREYEIFDPTNEEDKLYLRVDTNQNERRYFKNDTIPNR